MTRCERLRAGRGRIAYAGGWGCGVGHIDSLRSYRLCLGKLGTGLRQRSRELKAFVVNGVHVTSLCDRDHVRFSQLHMQWHYRTFVLAQLTFGDAEREATAYGAGHRELARGDIFKAQGAPTAQQA